MCDIVAGQRCMRKLTDFETRNMIKATAKKPPIRKAGTDAQMKKMKYGDDPHLKQFGFEVETSMVQVKGKVIQPPKLGYANNQTVQAQGGTWDAKGKQFFRPMSIKNWAILIFPPQNQCQTADVKV